MTILVSEADMDSLGHVNNASYVRYFERGRIDFYRRLELQLESTDPPRHGTVVVNLNVNFKRECFLGESLTLVTYALRRGNRSFVIGHHLEAEDGSLAADGETTCVVMDMDRRSVVELPPRLASLYGPGAPTPIQPTTHTPSIKKDR